MKQNPIYINTVMDSSNWTDLDTNYDYGYYNYTKDISNDMSETYGANNKYNSHHHTVDSYSCQTSQNIIFDRFFESQFCSLFIGEKIDTILAGL